VNPAPRSVTEWWSYFSRNGFLPIPVDAAKRCTVPGWTRLSEAELLRWRDRRPDLPYLGVRVTPGRAILDCDSPETFSAVSSHFDGLGGSYATVTSQTPGHGHVMVAYAAGPPWEPWGMTSLSVPLDGQAHLGPGSLSVAPPTPGYKLCGDLATLTTYRWSDWSELVQPPKWTASGGRHEATPCFDNWPEFYPAIAWGRLAPTMRTRLSRMIFRPPENRGSNSPFRRELYVIFRAAITSGLRWPELAPLVSDLPLPADKLQREFSAVAEKWAAERQWMVAAYSDAERYISDARRDQRATDATVLRTCIALAWQSAEDYPLRRNAIASLCGRPQRTVGDSLCRLARAGLLQRGNTTLQHHYTTTLSRPLIQSST